MARAALLAAVAATAASAALLLAAAAPLAGDAAAQLAPPEGMPPGQCCAAGSADGQFLAPEGVEINRGHPRFNPATSMILVADTGNHRIQVFHPNGIFAFKFGSHGDGDGEFDSPKDIAQGFSSDDRGMIAVADTGNHRIQVFHPNGTFAFKFGSHGDGDGEFDSPEGVAFDHGTGRIILVADTGNHRIQGFSMAGEFRFKFGSHGDGPLQFDGPRDIVHHQTADVVLVADTGNDRIEAILWRPPVTPERSMEFSIGDNHTGRTNKPREGAYALDGPRSVDLGTYTSQRLAVADTGNDRIQTSLALGELPTNIGSVGTGDGGFWSPSSVAVGRYGQVAVADTGNHRVKVYDAGSQAARYTDRTLAFVLGLPAPEPSSVAARALACAVP